MLPLGQTLLKAIFGGSNKNLNKELLGLKFDNPVGLAAGLDKDAKWIHELSALGFGFIEIGTITPKPQPGNDQPRLFRLRQDKALINRMGFNNLGADAAAERLRKRPKDIIVGGNIGKNKTTPNEEALGDYIYCIDKLYGLVDYFVVNVSSPNTPGLRELQEKEPLRKLLSGIKAHVSGKSEYCPVLLKVSPDLTSGQVDDIVEIITDLNVDGLIAANTTIERENLQTTSNELAKIGQGGLSGAPLRLRSNEILKTFREKLGNDFPIIGVGGIFTAEGAKEKLDAGADLVQVYTGLIYEGPTLINRIKKGLIQSLQK